MKTVFLRVLEAEDKATALLDAVRETDQAQGGQRFEVDQQSFCAVPRSPFAYWVSERVRGLFQTLRPFEADGREAFGGMKTQADERFLRAWWETGGTAWVPLCKGGKFSPYYSDVYLVTDWWNSGARPRAAYEVKSAGESWGGFGRNEAQYFRPGLTWPRRTSGLSLRAMPNGCIFGDKGPAAFVVRDDRTDLLALACVTNSRAFGFLVSLQLARTELAQSYEVGLIQSTPLPQLCGPDRDRLAQLGRRAWSLKRSLDTRNETSHAFTLPALLQVKGTDVEARALAWSNRVSNADHELVATQAEIDDRCFVLYGIDDADRRAIIVGFGTRASDEPSIPAAGNGEEDDAEDSDESPDAAVSGLAEELVSWSLGVAFGRFDVRLSTDGHPAPTEPDPFDALPQCSPGMLAGEDGRPLVRPPSGYPVAFPEGGVLVDDSGHAHDIGTALRAVIGTVFGPDADRWWNDVSALLDPRGRDLRPWLATGFFDHHLKRYSRSRRKAPIFWQLGITSGRYSVWLYAHRLTRDTFFQLLNKSDGLVAQKLAHEEKQLAGLVRDASASPSASQRKEIAAQQFFVEELRAMLDEIKRIAPLWNPNLDDGVVLTMAPLWRLVPQHKAWQKELRTKWEELLAGKYDWAHVAMYLWPERVVPKCATDRSLAIAHGLEDVFWVANSDGKFEARPEPSHSVDELVRERTSPSVKAALKSLIEAPVALGKGRAGRSRSRAEG